MLWVEFKLSFLALMILSEFRQLDGDDDDDDDNVAFDHITGRHKVLNFLGKVHNCTNDR